jgi:quinol monooxygenase YgiN
MTQSDTVVTVAQWTVNEHSLDEVLGKVNEARRQSLTEPGCVGYEVLQHVGDSDTLLILEHYRDPAALEAHRNSTHYREIAVGDILPRLMSRQVEILKSRD